MTRLDHNRAKAQLAAKCDVPVSAISNMAIWGNHSATQYPDLVHAQVNGKPAMELVDQAWVEGTYIPTVQQRGAQIIEARGASSAAFAARARPCAVKIAPFTSSSSPRSMPLVRGREPTSNA